MSRLFLAILCLIIASCSWLPDSKDETVNWTAEQFYKAGREARQSGDYARAIKLFEQLEGRYPYGRYAQQAILENAYANYKSAEPSAAIAACDRFIKLYPDHSDVDYAYYLKGLANFNDEFGFLSVIADQDMSERDPKASKESFEAFKELAAKFPQSRYANDAKARMTFLVNTLANHEVHVARYYYNRGAYVAAINRAQNTLTTYPQTPANEDALGILIQSYEKLGMKQLASDTRRLLEKNFPNSIYASGTERPWWKIW